MAFSQSRSVSGVVTDGQTGSPIPGVTVRVKEAPGVGTTTNEQGRYQLDVPEEGKTLLFSFVGYESREMPVSGNTINIKLQPGTELEQVVVIGYGTVKKKDLTGSVASVSGKDIAAAPVADIAKAMQGKLPGVNIVSQDGRPGAEVSIRVRGGGSISQSNQPLVLIDGVPGTLSDIPADQVESIAVMRERKLELLGEDTRRWNLIRSGKLSESAIAIQQKMETMINDLRSQGYHRFPNGNEISAYIWTKSVHLDDPLTFDCQDTTNPALYPAWRGQYDYSSLPAVSGKIEGTDHNLAIRGLFHYIDPQSAEAASLESKGYIKTNWGIDIVNNSGSYKRNILSGITSADDPPRYYWPISFETISNSDGKITNGYGLPQQ